MNILTQLKSDPASFGGGGGQVITSESGVVGGPFYILKALGGDVVLAGGTLPAVWGGGSLAGQTISDGDQLILRDITKVSVTSGTLVAYGQPKKQAQ